MEDLNRRLEAVTLRRDTADAKCQRIEGRLEAARTALAEVEKECRAKGLDPANLDATISELKDRYQTLVENLERAMEQAEQALAPFEALGKQTTWNGDLL